jgi:hypothetical protein
VYAVIEIIGIKLTSELDIFFISMDWPQLPHTTFWRLALHIFPPTRLPFETAIRHFSRLSMLLLQSPDFPCAPNSSPE